MVLLELITGRWLIEPEFRENKSIEQRVVANMVKFELGSGDKSHRIDGYEIDHKLAMVFITGKAVSEKSIRCLFQTVESLG